MESQLSDQTSQENNVDVSAYKEVTKNFAIKAWESDNAENPVPAMPQVASITPIATTAVASTIPIVNTEPTPITPTIQAFSARTIPVPTFSLGDVIKKILIIVFSALPLILLLLSFISFVMEMSMDISQIGQYPSWATAKLEEFVKNTIMPLLNTQ